FAQYEELDAVEYTPASNATGNPPLRVYYFAHEAATTWLARSAKTDGTSRASPERGPHKDTTERGGYFYDAKGRQPFHGGWRTPVPFARIASRFNPKRMH